jgi:hypothetical protein
MTVLILNTILLHLVYTIPQANHIYHGIAAAFAVEVAANPVGEAVGQGNRVEQKIPAGDLSDIDRYVALRGRDRYKAEDRSRYNGLHVCHSSDSVTASHESMKDRIYGCRSGKTTNRHNTIGPAAGHLESKFATL